MDVHMKKIRDASALGDSSIIFCRGLMYHIIRYFRLYARVLPAPPIMDNSSELPPAFTTV